jgi:hypothetical protein
MGACGSLRVEQSDALKRVVVRWDVEPIDYATVGATWMDCVTTRATTKGRIRARPHQPAPVEPTTDVRNARVGRTASVSPFNYWSPAKATIG